MTIYMQTVKKNIFLVLIMIVLMFFTYGWWLLMPFFVFPSLFFHLGIPPFLVFIIIFLSVGILFSIFFIPLNWSFAKVFASKRDKKKISVFFFTQGITVLSGSILMVLVFFIFFYFINK